MADGSQTFLTRTFDFDGDAWRVRFSGWADPQRKHRLFDGVAEGGQHDVDEHINCRNRFKQRRILSLSNRRLPPPNATRKRCRIPVCDGNVSLLVERRYAQFCVSYEHFLMATPAQR